MDPQRRARYEQLMRETREEIDGIESRVEEILAEVKERIEGLNQEKEAQLTIYDGYCRLLGVPNELADEDEDD